jgi:autotransporter-associated beta strand protein
VTNNALSYTLSGAGRISGISSLVKYGSASLTLAETGGDNFSGGIAVHGGSIILDDPNSNISGGLTNDAGTVVQFGNNDANGVLPLGGLDNEGTLVFKRTDNVLLATVISGGGGLVQGGSGTLNSSVVNTYTGNTTVTNGTLTLSGPGSIASPLATVNSATLDVSSSDGSGSHFNTVALTNATFNVSNVLTTVTSLRTTNSTINLVADANITVGGQADISATGLITAGAANTIKVSSIQNLVLSPTLPIIMPLISYSSATFAGGFNFGLIPPLGVSGYISNDVANSSVDLVITNAPQSITWNGGSSTGNNWTDAANWGGTPIGALDALTFDGVNRLNNTNDTAAGTLYTNITFNSGAGIFTLNGNPINFRGTMLNNSSSTQAVNLGFTLNAACSFDGGTAGGALAVSGGVTNISATSQTVTLLDVGTMKDLWATNAGANGGGQLQFLLGTAGGDWTILDGTGTGGLVSPGNVQFTLSAGAPGGAIDFGTVSSAPNVDVGAGFVSIASPATGNSNAFNINNGKLKANGMVLPASGAGYLNMNGGTLILGTNSFTGGGGAGGGLVVANINGGSIYSTNGGIFQVTARCPAAFNINGGLVQCGTFEISAGTASSGNGTNYLNGGTLICTNITCGLFAGNASSTMYFNGGTLKAGTNSANFITKNNLAPLTLNVSTNGAVIDTTNFSETISLPLIHDANLDLSQVTQDGGLIKLGVGTLTLSAVNTYTGSNTVSGGTLLVSGSVLGDAIVGVAGTLAGTGTVGGQVTVNGTLAPGTPAATGVLTVSSNVTINASGTNIMKLKKGSLTNDVLSVAQTLTYGGTLNLTNISGTLAANDSFKLFNAGTYAGAFTSIFPATPGAGLAWNTNNLTLNGTLSITSVGPITNANITQVTLVGTNVVIHGTNNNVPNSSFHYVVLTSTNLTLPLSNWTPVITNSFNGSGTFDYTNPIVPGQPKLFYDVQAVP